MSTTRQAPPEKRTGPEPERLAIPGDWKQAVERALKKGKPPAPKQAAKKKGRHAK